MDYPRNSNHPFESSAQTPDYFAKMPMVTQPYPQVDPMSASQQQTMEQMQREMQKMQKMIQKQNKIIKNLNVNHQ